MEPCSGKGAQHRLSQHPGPFPSRVSEPPPPHLPRIAQPGKAARSSPTGRKMELVSDSLPDSKHVLGLLILVKG